MTMDSEPTATGPTPIVQDVSPGAMLVTPPPEAPRRQTALFIVSALAILALLAVCIWFIYSTLSRNNTLAARISEQNHTISKLSDEISASNDNAKTLYDQLIQLGEKPNGSNPSDIVPGPAGQNGQAGPVGPTGATGTPGANATDNQVADAVAGYCAGLNFCRGDTGKTGAAGANGANGVDGTAGMNGTNGTDGQNATDAQVGEAVQDYCTVNNECQGPAGKDGMNGTNGKDGTDGATGPPGPTCPDGYTATTVWLSVADSQFGTFHRTQAVACIPTPSPAPTPTP
jgi:hypothetical protein